MRPRWLLWGILPLLSLSGCPAEQVKTRDRPPPRRETANGTAPRPSPPPLRRPFRPKLVPVPKKVETFRLRKGIPVQFYVREKGILSHNESKEKTWDPQIIPRKGSRSWFARLKPDPGVKLGTYVVIHLIIAVYAGAASYQTSGRFSVRFLLRSGKKETEIFRTMLLARGSRYALYRMLREISQDWKVKEGDYFILRVAHRGGSNGAVGVGGDTGAQGGQLVVSPNPITKYYRTNRGK